MDVLPLLIFFLHTAFISWYLLFCCWPRCCCQLFGVLCTFYVLLNNSISISLAYILLISIHSNVSGMFYLSKDIFSHIGSLKILYLRIKVSYLFAYLFCWRWWMYRLTYYQMEFQPFSTFRGWYHQFLEVWKIWM